MTHAHEVIRPGELISLKRLYEIFGIGVRVFGRWKRAFYEATGRDLVRRPATATGWVLTDDIFLIMRMDELPEYEPEYKWKRSASTANPSPANRFEVIHDDGEIIPLEFCDDDAFPNRPVAVRSIGG